MTTDVLRKGAKYAVPHGTFQRDKDKEAWAIPNHQNVGCSGALDVPGRPAVAGDPAELKVTTEGWRRSTQEVRTMIAGPGDEVKRENAETGEEGVVRDHWGPKNRTQLNSVRGRGHPQAGHSCPGPESWERLSKWSSAHVVE